MIDAKDLRIGNWVMGIYKPTQIVGEDFKCDPIDCKPIELTEDILLKWGFGNKRNTNINGCIEYTYLNSMNLSKSYDLILTIHNGIYRLYYKLEIIGVRRLKYIHQFQNFFQIITEKELTVQL